MAIELNLSNGDFVEFAPGLPSDYVGPVFRGSVAFTATTDAAQLIAQEFVGDQYCIRFSIGKFFEKVSGTGMIQRHGLHSCLMLKSDIRKEIAKIGKLHVRQGQYSCFFTEPTTYKLKFEKGTEYRALDIFYSPKLLEELLPFFPELKNILSSPSPALLGKIGWSLPSMKEITHQILNCPYDESTRQFYFDLKVRELLYQILENTYRRKGKLYTFTPWEIARIHEARDILESHISKKPPTIRSLSRQVALNEFKLKTGFRQYFNSSMFDWLMDKKMQHAKNLILTTNRPIKDICTMVGYPRTTNFITAFLRRFGMTPGSLRRQ